MSIEPPSWVRGPIRIRRAVLEAIEQHALESYPSESCGFLLGPAADGPLLDGTPLAPQPRGGWGDD